MYLIKFEYPQYIYQDITSTVQPVKPLVAKYATAACIVLNGFEKLPWLPAAARVSSPAPSTQIVCEYMKLGPIIP